MIIVTEAGAAAAAAAAAVPAPAPGGGGVVAVAVAVAVGGGGGVGGVVLVLVVIVIVIVVVVVVVVAVAHMARERLLKPLATELIHEAALQSQHGLSGQEAWLQADWGWQKSTWQSVCWLTDLQFISNNAWLWKVYGSFLTGVFGNHCHMTAGGFPRAVDSFCRTRPGTALDVSGGSPDIFRGEAEPQGRARSFRVLLAVMRLLKLGARCKSDVWIHR